MIYHHFFIPYEASVKSVNVEALNLSGSFPNLYNPRRVEGKRWRMIRDTFSYCNELSMECGTATTLLELASRVSICPYSREIREVTRKAEELIERLLTLNEDLNKAMKKGRSDLFLDMLSLIQNNITSLNKELNELLKKLDQSCKKDGRCCVAEELIEKAIKNLDSCLEKTKESISKMRNIMGLCESCLYFSELTGLCIKMRVKVTDSVPPCRGMYFKPIKEEREEVKQISVHA
ncbi:hypothetical protein IPA_03565 [Ignicoccus pacificus DSM 13166]|uniref:Uncharacterized protein n=1 Tax=Ignicoccus pacificus DSM 13166 TaxID=940294 RepID=A0A977KAY7_9CREN|nr:hypothetical protein IPA_03565 [Ignicoccus pacificus DSM 13166]